MLYEDTSHIERLLFKMKKYDYAKTIKGAYHQNPAYTHWYGNAELKMDLIDIKAEASRLKARRQAISGTPPGDSPDERLLLLRKRFDRGEISGEAYDTEKTKIIGDFLKKR